MATVGDLIYYRGDRGIICACEPLVMKTIHFHSYVPILGSYELLQRLHDPSTTIRAEVLERIKKYIANMPNMERPTGDVEVENKS